MSVHVLPFRYSVTLTPLKNFVYRSAICSAYFRPALLIRLSFSFPIFPAVAFLEYDPADIPILIGTFAFGPVVGLILTVVTAVVQGLTVSAASGLYGILMHVIATGVLVVAAGSIYRHKKTRTMAVVALLCGMAAMAVVMMGANMVITPIFMGVPASAVWSLMPFIVGFNVIKAGINGAVTFVLYKRIANFLRK